MTDVYRSIGVARSRLLNVQQGRLDRARDILFEFGTRLGKSENPVHTLRWADDQFRAAAVVEVSSWIIAALEQDAPLDAILAHLLDKLHYYATAGSSSTSVTSNLIDRRLGAIYAQEHREVSYTIAWVED